jgi:hypothetical protein
MSNSPTRINWAQIDDLLGVNPAADSEISGLLQHMWLRVKRDALAEWPGMDLGAEELRESLHRLRGVLACWGLEGVAGVMLAVERGPNPEQAWRERSGELHAELRAVFAEVEARHGFLAGE